MAISGQGSNTSTKSQDGSQHTNNTTAANRTDATTQRSQAFETDLRQVRGKTKLERYRAEKDGPISGHLVTSTGKFKTRVSTMLPHIATLSCSKTDLANRNSKEKSDGMG